jgi:hypothetical protein
MRGAAVAGTVILVSVLLAACAEPVQVTVRPVEVIEDHPTQVKLLPNIKAEGLTDWFFHCRPKIELDSQVNGNQAKVTVIGVNMEVGLTIREQVVAAASPELKAHEKGHATICKRLYSGANALCQELCRGIIGKEFTGEGANPTEAVEAAREKAAHEICEQFLQQTARRADVISEEYDRITVHAQSNLAPSVAIDQAFKEEAKPVPSKRL